MSLFSSFCWKNAATACHHYGTQLLARASNGATVAARQGNQTRCYASAETIGLYRSDKPTIRIANPSTFRKNERGNRSVLVCFPQVFTGSKRKRHFVIPKASLNHVNREYRQSSSSIFTRIINYCTASGRKMEASATKAVNRQKIQQYQRPGPLEYSIQRKKKPTPTLTSQIVENSCRRIQRQPLSARNGFGRGQPSFTLTEATSSNESNGFWKKIKKFLLPLVPAGTYWQSKASTNIQTE